MYTKNAGKKIMDEGLDVKEFEKEWEEFKDKF